jgi:cystathionine gamma-synthase
MAAIAAVVETLPIPGRVVVAADAYNGTRRLFADLAGRGRLRFRTVDLAASADVLSVCSEVVEGPGRPSGSKDSFGSGGLLWLESPTNPLLSIADIATLARGAHELGMDVVVDNTFASPLGQHPLDLGADVVVHSATKILSGHSDALIGAVVTRRDEVLAQVSQRRALHGAIPGSLESWLALRGARTLSLRQSKAAASAGVLAERLAEHRLVSRVYYPGLASHPGHDLARRQMSDFGTMVSFEVLGGARAADAVCGALRLLTVATSLGGVETLIERRSRWAGEEAIPAGLLRMSVGIEDVEDLWADLSDGLLAVQAARGEES